MGTPEQSKGKWVLRGGKLVRESNGGAPVGESKPSDVGEVVKANGVGDIRQTRIVEVFNPAFYNCRGEFLVDALRYHRVSEIDPDRSFRTEVYTKYSHGFLGDVYLEVRKESPARGLVVAVRGRGSDLDRIVEELRGTAKSKYTGDPNRGIDKSRLPIIDSAYTSASDLVGNHHDSMPKRGFLVVPEIGLKGEVNARTGVYSSAEKYGDVYIVIGYDVKFANVPGKGRTMFQQVHLIGRPFDVSAVKNALGCETRAPK